MKVNPRLDLFEVQLKARNGEYKTFSDFVRENVNGEAEIERTSEELAKFIFGMMATELAKNESSRKMLCVVNNKSINRFHKKIPSFNNKTDIISGVINGGPYGRDGILLNMDDEKDTEKLDKNKTVLSYYYIFLYLPKDHNSGLAMIHSNSTDENITPIFKEFLRKCFKADNYYNAQIDNYSPKKFQEEFIKSSSLHRISFKQTIVENKHSDDPIKNELLEYDIQIIATPKNKKLPAKKSIKFFEVLQDKVLQITKSQSKSLVNFAEQEVTYKESSSKTQRTFEWNTRDKEFTPTIYLNDHLSKKNSDGTPDFDELAAFCKGLFENDIFDEINPLTNVQRIDRQP